LLSATLRVNSQQPRRVVDMLEQELGGVANARIAIWGLAFKAGTDDVRDSLALRIIADLHERGAKLLAFDPSVRSFGFETPCEMASSAIAALDGADALLVLTEWPQFLEIPAWTIAARLRQRVVVDGRNLFDPDVMADAGLRYRGVGRKPNGSSGDALAAVG
jgi:UDPglucose 6-dehydrogenase